MNRLIGRFNSISSLQSNLEKEIEETESLISEYSNILGEKIRQNEEQSKDDPDFLEFKQKLEGNTGEKKSPEKDDSKKPSNKPKKSSEKKKKSSKKGDANWYNLNEIMIYNGIGLKGELELYFKAIDDLKQKLETLQRTLQTLKGIIEKGLKEDMGCVAFQSSDGPLEISFLKNSDLRKNFSLKSIYSGIPIPVENILKIGV